MREEHGVPGQLNGCVLDKDSIVTNYGKHNRLTMGLDHETSTIELREDIKGLPLTTEKDRRKFLMCWQYRLHPKGTKLQFKQKTEGENDMKYGKSIWYEYEIIRRKTNEK